MEGKRMVECNLCELAVDLVEQDGTQLIRYFFYTDLPVGTRVILSCHRTYTNVQGEQCVWLGYGEAVLTKPSANGSYSGAEGLIDVAVSDRLACERFNQTRSTFSPGIASAVSSVLTVVLTVGARQPRKDFGRNNINLSGRMVHSRGELNVVNVFKKIEVPLSNEFQPVITHGHLRSDESTD